MQKFWNKIEGLVLAMFLVWMTAFPTQVAFADMTAGSSDKLNQRNRITTAVPSETATRKIQQLQVAVAPIGNSTTTIKADDREIYVAGVNLNIAGSTEETVWDGSTVYSYANTATAAAVECVSDSNSDSKTSTGINSVHLWGLSGAYALQEEDVYLYGQNPKWTENTYIRILGVQAKTYGTGLTSAGNIYVGTGTCTTGVPATIYAQARTGINKSQSAIFTVPADMYATITGWGVDASKGDEVYGRLVIRNGGTLPDQGFYQADKLYAYQTSVSREGGSVPIATADAGSDIEVRAAADAIGTTVNCYMKIILRSK